MNKRILIHFNVKNGQFDATSNMAMKELLKLVKIQMDKQQKGVTTAIAGDLSFDRTIKNLAKNIGKKVKQRFYHNPMEWQRLSETTIKTRNFRKNPELFKKRLEKAWFMGQSRKKEDLENIIEFPDFSFKSRKLDKAMSPSYPALLQTGDLSRSISFEYISNNSPIQNSRGNYFLRRSRVLQFKINNLPYAKTQFYGGTSVVHVLTKSFVKKNGEEKDIFIPVPDDFVLQLVGKKQQLEAAGFSLEKRIINIPARNPLFFDKEDAILVEDLLNRLGNNYRADLSKFWEAPIINSSGSNNKEDIPF
jgi:hypothetical protein